MSPEPRPPSHLYNALATVEQLSSSGSQLDGISADLESSILHAGARITQLAGILLRLPQEVIASAIVTLQRFFTGPEGGSLRDHGVRDISAASLYLTAKTSAQPKSPRTILSVYAVLSHLPVSSTWDAATFSSLTYQTCHLTEGAYQTQRRLLTKHETLVLRTLGFDARVALPFALCVNYLQALDVFRIHDEGARVAKVAMGLLNAVLVGPQRVYLTHQPTALATAAVYLAARGEGVKLPAGEWWEVFDCEREELGFLVVAMLSVEGWVREERRRWGSSGREVPVTVEELERYLERGEGEG